MKIFLTDVLYSCISSFIRQYMKMTRRLPVLAIYSSVHSTSQLKGIQNDTFSVKMVCKRVKGSDPGVEKSLPPTPA